jgi:hypothetical protein
MDNKYDTDNERIPTDEELLGADFDEDNGCKITAKERADMELTKIIIAHAEHFVSISDITRGIKYIAL